MPIIPTFMSSQSQLTGTGLGLVGSKFSSLVKAVSNAVATYIVSAAVVQGTNQVTGPGAGTHTGTISGITGPGMSSLMKTKATLLGLVGSKIGTLFDALSAGIVASVKQGIAQGSVVGGGPGIGTAKIMYLQPTVLSKQIQAQMIAMGLVGEKAGSLADAIAFGVVQHIQSAATVQTTCIGAFAGPPAGPVLVPAAPSIGVLK